MRFALVVPLAVAAVVASCSVVHAQPAGVPAVRLNEILPGPARDWDGSGAFSSRDDEWIELRNDGTVPVDLTGFFLTDGDSVPRLALSGTIAPLARLVAFGRDAYDWERANGMPAVGFSLANSGDAVMLWWAAAGDTALVDVYAYRSHEAAADRAVGRADDDGAWTLFDGLNPYTGTLPPPHNGCPPTPDAPNQCEPVPSRNASWGALKVLYRGVTL